MFGIRLDQGPPAPADGTDLATAEVNATPIIEAGPVNFWRKHGRCCADKGRSIHPFGFVGYALRVVRLYAAKVKTNDTVVDFTIAIVVNPIADFTPAVPARQTLARPSIHWRQCAGTPLDRR